MADRPTRRRAIAIFASATASLTGIGASRAAEEWRGSALGAEVSIVFDEVDPASRRVAVDRIMAEIERQESIFSLQMARSELSRLNAEGRLARPSGDLLYVLERAREIHAATSGKFDPTVQTLWRNYVAWYASDRGRKRPPDEWLASFAGRIGLGAVRIEPDAIVLPPGVELTLNGIAQGHITDSGVRILRDLGFKRVLVDLGETRAMDDRADGSAWRVRLPDETPVALRDVALATSAGAATSFAANGDHHIFDPHTRRPARIWNWLSVSHPSAAIADGLSTGLYCLTPDACRASLASFPGARLWGQTADGVRRTLPA
jgi:thiamine biosynthesis lipoprotein